MADVGMGKEMTAPEHLLRHPTGRGCCHESGDDGPGPPGGHDHFHGQKPPTQRRIEDGGDTGTDTTTQQMDASVIRQPAESNQDLRDAAQNCDETMRKVSSTCSVIAPREGVASA